MSDLPIKRIVSVVFEGGKKVKCTDDDLRAYLANRELQERGVRKGWNLASMALYTAIRKVIRDAGRTETLRMVQKTHEADARRTEKELREAVRRLEADPDTPAHKVRSRAAEAAGISRARADQILGPVGKVKRGRKSKAPS